MDLLSAFVAVWFVLHISAIVMAYYNTESKEGSSSRKTALFIIALIAGPFFWPLYFSEDNI